MTETQLLDRVRQLREQGRSPKEIARCLGVRPATVSPLVRALAEERSAAATEPAVAGCWVSPGWSIGLGLEGFADWPGLGVSCPGQSGLVAVLVAREHRYGRVSVCGYLVDTWCLGVQDQARSGRTTSLSWSLSTDPERGGIYWADRATPTGSRPAKRRPVPVISADTYNRSLEDVPRCRRRAERRRRSMGCTRSHSGR